ncbi:Putative ribokinase [Sporothrix bragantina]|uniref:Ribokinase n=1 Tax=Sporothrix bragantina TaxID=671064 RepID=A0ABP0BZF7_9PEZI
MASPTVGLPVGTPFGSPHALSPSIMVIGSLNADLVTYTPRIPAAGETMTANGFRTGLGGKGANQAVACAKIGRRRGDATPADLKGAVPVYMVGAVGDDVYGQTMTSSLTAAGVDVSGIAVRAGQSTGVAVIIVDEAAGGENRIMLSAEANGSLTPDEYAMSLPTPGGGLPSLLLLQLEIPLPTVLQILETAHRQGVAVLLNAAPAQMLPDSYYKCITHLVVNETEASFLSGTALDLSGDDSQRDKELSRVAGHFLALGVQHVVITLGAAGVFHATSSDSGHIPAVKTKVLDTTAAGDTFIGAYALALVQGQTVAEAVQWANRAAAVAVGRRGAQESIPWLDEL